MISEEKLQDIYTAAVHAESQRDDDDSFQATFELYELLEDVCGSPASALRQLIDMYRAAIRQNPTNRAVADVIAERRRQVSIEGWTPEHDDLHVKGEMVFAAIAYLMTVVNPNAAIGWWLWEPEWWKPKSPRRDLERAGALILAEIERLDRADNRSTNAEDITP